MDQLGVWDCALSPFTAFEEIPAKHMEAWGVAMDKVQWDQSSPDNSASHYSDQSIIKLDILAA